MGGPGSGRKKGSGSKHGADKKTMRSAANYAKRVSKKPKSGYIPTKTINKGKSTISVYDISGKRIG